MTVPTPTLRRAFSRWVQRWGDLVLGLALAVGGVVELWTYPGAQVEVAVPAGALAGLVLAVRRRVPLVAFAVVFGCLIVIATTAPGFMGHSVAMVAVFMIILYSLGANTAGISAWIGGVGVLATVVALDLQDGDDSPSGIFFFLLFAGLPWVTGLVIRLRIARVRELAATNAALQEEARRAVAEERARIARELHDVVSHAIAVTILQARGARKTIGRDEQALRQALDAIEQTNSSALADMRRLLALLRTSDGDDGHGADGRDEPAPGLDRLEQLAGQVRASGLPVEIMITGDPLPLPPGLDLSAFRIVQEALTNVIKHGGPGATARVVIDYGVDGLRLSVINTGRTGGSGTPGGHGLIGIRERALVANGRAETGPTEDGFAVLAELPYLIATPGTPTGTSTDATTELLTSPSTGPA